MDTEHTYLVAVTVEVGAEVTRAEAELAMHGALPKPGTPLGNGAQIASWWVAEDDRQDWSDNDSAMFVPYRQGCDRAKLTEDEREQLLEDWDGFASELLDRFQLVLASRYGRT